ncbi:MAG: tetratricopeptide repeat protein [Anaerolineales bacterium]
MSRKNFPTRVDPTRLPRRLREGLEEASELIEHRQPAQAFEVLSDLDDHYPRQPDVLGQMANAHLDLKNMPGYLHTMIRLHEITPNRVDVKLGLAGAYLSNERLALALRTFRQFLKQWPRDERAADVQKTISKLEASLGKILGELDFTLETGLDFAYKHEELQVCMETGEYERCKRLVKTLNEQRPDFVPVLNNLSQVYWLEGNLPEAIETCRKVLEIEPDNIHALSNLTRFLYMQGKQEEARTVAKRLKESTAEASDRLVKKAEGLSFIQDDAAVLSLLETAERGREIDNLDHAFYHWCAVAEYRRGNLTAARSQWKKSFKLAPSFELASVNLEELKKPMQLRDCPQVFSIDMWLSKKVVGELTSAVERAAKKKNDQEFRVKIQAYFNSRPEILNFILAALDRGDTLSKDLAVKLTDMSGHLALLSALKDFALSQKGTDAMRMEASQVLAHHGVFESGQEVTLWWNGELRPMLMLGFEVSYEPPKESPLKPAVQNLMVQAVNALREKNGQKAEEVLRKGLQIQPDEPSLLNNLAFALSLQGKNEASNALANRVAEEFPDYFFGQTIAARKAIQVGDLEKAKVIIDRLLQRKELHVTEFSALCMCQIDFMIANKKPDGAVSWYDIWKQGYPDDPRLEEYKSEIAVIEAFTKLKDEISPGSRRKIKKNKIV